MNEIKQNDIETALRLKRIHALNDIRMAFIVSIRNEDPKPTWEIFSLIEGLKDINQS